MSYILDALRRAEAERQRGAVPGLHDQPAPGPATAQAGARRPILPPLAWALLGLLGLALAMAAGWWLRPAPRAAEAVARPATSTHGAPAGPATQIAAAPALPEPAATATVPPRLPAPAPTATPPAPGPALASAAAPPATRLAASPASPAAQPLPPLARATAAPPLRDPPPPRDLAPAGPGEGLRPAAGPPAPPAAAAPAPAPAVAPAAAPARLPSLAELPEPQRREIGPLTVGGAMHADQAALRMVILNGQVFHEGDKVGPELQVQQIRLKSVVLSHRGQRFELPF